MVRHVFRLLKRAQEDCRAVPWVLLENVRPRLVSCRNSHAAFVLHAQGESDMLQGL